MSTRTALISILLLIIGVNSINDCKYFGAETGPLLPLDVCTKWDTEYVSGSYSYHCDGFDDVFMYWWDNDDCSGMATATSEYAVAPVVVNCGGGICDHVIVREYQFTEIRENMCYRNESENAFFEYAFVTDCWDSVVFPDVSWYDNIYLSYVHNTI